MVHVFCTSSHSALHLCEVSWIYLRWYQSYGVDTNDGRAERTDELMDTKNFGLYNIIPSPLFVVGHKKYKIASKINLVKQLQALVFVKTLQVKLYNITWSNCFERERQQCTIWSFMRNDDMVSDNQGPVVQSVVSLTSSLRVISLTVLAYSIHNILIFFAEKMWVAFALLHCKSYSHFFRKKFQHICVSLDVNFKESLTNDIVSFEQLGPGVLCPFQHYLTLVMLNKNSAEGGSHLVGQKSQEPQPERGY